MKTTRNTSSEIFRIRRWQTGKSAGFAPSGIVLFIVILSWIIGGLTSFGQGVGISEVSIVPNSSSILELQSTLRGFLAPRMSTAQRLAIATPANGLLVYDTDKKSFFYWESISGTWKSIAATTLGSSNQLLGMDAAGNLNEYKTLNLIPNVNISITHGVGTIDINTTQNINTLATPSFAGLTVTGLTPNRGVYTDGSSALTSSPPTNGILGYWNRSGNILSPTTTGDFVTTSGNISTTGSGTITSAGLLTGSSGATVNGATNISGGTINLNNNSGFATNINTGTSGGSVTIGNSLNTITLPAFATAGLVHNSAGGVLFSGLLTNADITNGTIDVSTKVTGILSLTNGGTNTNLSGGAAIGDLLYANSLTTFARLADITSGNVLLSGGTGISPAWGKVGLTSHVSGVLPIGNGGTNSGTALNGSSIMISNGTAIVQGDKGTISTVLHGNATGVPTYGQVLTVDIADANVTPVKIQPGAINQVLVTDGLGAVAWINRNAFGSLSDGFSIEGDGTLAFPFRVKDLGIITAKLADGAVTTIKLADDAVTTVKILNANVTNSKLADNSVTTSKIVDANVTTSKILDANVTTSKIADANVTPIKIQPGAINQVLVTDALGAVAWINRNAFGSLSDGLSIEGDGTLAFPFRVKDLGIITAKLADGAVTTVKLADDAVTTVKILDANVTNSKLADNSVTTSKIVDANVTTSKILDANITTAKIADANVTTAKIADANVTPIKIQPGAINQVLVTDGLGAVAWINRNAFGSLSDGFSIEGDGTLAFPFRVKDLGIITAKLADGAVTTIKLADNAVTTVKITDANITTSKIADANVTNSKLADNSVTTSKIVDANVTTSKILDANITTSKIADANVTPIKIQPGAINQVLVTDGLGAVAWINRNAFGSLSDGFSIEGDGTLAFPFRVKDLGIITAKLADGAVTTIKLADNAVTTVKITDANITTSKIADANVTNSKLADNSVTTSKIVDANVTTSKILDANITTSKIADANVTPIKIQPGAINQVLVTDALGAVAWINRNAFGSLSDGLSIEGDGTLAFPFRVKDLGIITAKLADGAVTTIKLADNAVTTVKITDANITTSKIADANVTNSKLADNSVTTSKIVDANVTTSKILDANVTTSKIADANVTPVKIQPGAINQVLVTDALGAVAWINRNAFGSLSDGLSIEGDGTLAFPFRVKDLGIITAKLADGAVTTIKLADNAVTTVKITDANITTSKIADANVTNSKLADNSVTTSKIVDANVTTSKILDANITTSKIADANVTTAKIADANVTAAKLTAGAGTAGRVGIADVLGVVTYGNVPAGSVTGNNLTSTDLTVTGGTGATLTPVTLNIANNAVTYAKMQNVGATSRLLGSSSTTTPVQEISLGGGLIMTGATLSTTDLGGTVTSFSSGDLSPLFTTSVTNPTLTPALSFSLSNANAYTIFGNNTNASAAPAYFSPVLASALFAGQGTTSQVLHGAGAGNPSWSQIIDADIDALANIADTKLATISTPGKVSNSATTATSTNAANTIVLRDASNNFSAGTVTADLTGNVNGNVTGSAASFTGSLAGEVTGTQGSTVVGNSAVIGKLLTGYTSGAGTVLATDNILQAIQKLNGNAVLGSNATHTGDATGATALTVVGINGTLLSGLSTGILRNTNGTGVPSIAIATDFPTLNQNTTGSAGSFTGSLAGEVTGTQGSTVVGNSAVLGKLLTGYVSGAGTVAATDNILQAIQKLNGNDAINANLTGMVTSVGNATTVVTNANLNGEVTSIGNATTITNSAVMSKLLTGYTSGAGTVLATDNILQAIQKLNGNAVLGSNATHTGDATGATALTVVGINGTLLSGLSTGILRNTNGTGVPSIAIATDFPTLNQNTTGSAGSFTGSLAGEVTGTQGSTVVGNSAVLGKLLTGYVSGAGTVAATDNILQAIQKLNGNDAINANLTGMVTSVGNATTVVTNANLNGEVTSIGNATTITNSAVMSKLLTGYTSGAGTVLATDNILQAIQKLNGNAVLGSNATHTGDATGATALTVVGINGTLLSGLSTGILRNTNGTGVPSIAIATDFPTLNQNTTGSAGSFTGSLAGEVTGTQGSTVVDNAAVLGKLLTGYVSGAGTVAATDNILQAIQKLNGNDAINANLTGMVTSVGNATTVVTNANLTGEVTSVGNATTISTNTVTNAKFRQGAGLSVVGVTGSAVANVADIVGVTDQVLRVNSSGSGLAFGSIDLSKTATIGTSILPIANGGTGSATQNFVDLTTGQTIGGAKTFTGAISASNLSGTNTGDNAANTLYSGLVSNATHTGDATGSTALTVVRINGTLLSGLATGILKNTTGTGVPTIASAGIDFAPPTSGTSFLTGNGSGGFTNVSSTGSGNVVLATSPTLATPVINGTISGSTVIPVANGGMGQSSALVAGGVLYGASTNAAGITAAGNTGEVLTSNGAGTPTWEYPNLTFVENYLGANRALGANSYSTQLASVTLPAGTWLITSETTISYSPAGGTGTYWNATAVIGTGNPASQPTTAYTSGEGSTRTPGSSLAGPIQISLSKIVTLASSTVVSTYAAANVAATVVITPPNNPSTAGTATGIHAVRIR